MVKMKAAYTGFIPRGPDTNPEEYLKKYAAMGFKGTSAGPWMAKALGLSHEENYQHLLDMGYERAAMMIGTSVQKELPDLDALKKMADLYHVKEIGTYHTSCAAHRFGDRADVPNNEEVDAELGRMRILSDELAKDGYSFVFHNHDSEFTYQYKGVPLFFMMADRCPNLKFCIDTGWAHYAGYDPARIIRELGDRVVELHVKDYTYGENYEHKVLDGKPIDILVPRYCAPGSGVTDLYKILQAGAEVGCKWATIEQDMQFNLNHADAALCAILNMRETGFVE